MVRARCPLSLRKYGFCGVLAVLYAARLKLPSSVAKLETLLDEVKRVFWLGKGKWTRSTPKNTGGISLPDTLCLLDHFQGCEAEVLRTKRDAHPPTLRQWVKSVSAGTCYIVHLRAHAFFVEVGAAKGKWRLYDQDGAHTRANAAFLERVGSYWRQHVRAVIKITYLPREGAP